VSAVNAVGVEDPTPAVRLFQVGRAETHWATCIANPFRLLPYPGHLNQYYDGCQVLPRAVGCPASVNSCGYLDDRCPAGAQCTVSMSHTFSEADSPSVYWIVQGWVKHSPLDQAGRFTGAGPELALAGHCDSIPNRCTTTASKTFFGAGDYVTGHCGSVSGIFEPQLFGPDEARVTNCQVTLRITPAVALSATASGTSGSAYVPGAGTLTIGSAGGAASGKLAMAGKPRMPAFRTIKAKAKAAGPVSFKFKLSKPTARTYKRKGKVKLSLRSSFKPADGGKTLKRKQKLTLVKPPELAPTPLP
jgi:hypothetical protein